MVSTTSYTSKDIMNEIRKRASKGEDVMQYYFIGGQTIRFLGPGGYGPSKDGSNCRKGSQRYIALQTLLSTEELMREIQSRVLSGRKTAWFEWKAGTHVNKKPSIKYRR